MSSSRQALWAIALLSLLAYANALAKDFTYDDFVYITWNDNLHLPPARLF